MGRKESAPILNENAILDATNCNENHQMRRQICSDLFTSFLCEPSVYPCIFARNILYLQS